LSSPLDKGDVIICIEKTSFEIRKIKEKFMNLNEQEIEINFKKLK